MILSIRQDTNMQKKRFVDTNVFIYTLFPVDRIKQDRSIALFQKAANSEVVLWTTGWVIAEIVWFLERQKIKTARIKEIITKILATEGLEIDGRKFILKVLDLWEEGTDYIDVVNLVLVKEQLVKEGYSYDKGLCNFKWFTRLEP
jgi:predicted nucleic-acid-binding protein